MRILRCALALSVSLLTFYPSSVHGQSADEVVECNDSRISYIGQWQDSSNGGYHYFTSQDGSFSMDFTGSAVAWYSRRLYSGATVLVTLDDNAAVSVDLSAGMQENDTPVVQALYSKSGLDASSHRVTVKWDGPGGNQVFTFVETYYLKITKSTAQSTTAAAAAAPVQSKPTSASSSSSSSSSKPAAVSTPASGTTTELALKTVTVSRSTSPGSSSSSSSRISSSNSNSSSGSRSATNIIGSSPSSSIASSTAPVDGWSTGILPTASSGAVASSASAQSQLNVAALAGGISGGIVAIALAIALLLCLRRRRLRKRDSEKDIQSAVPFVSSQRVSSGKSVAFLHARSSKPPSGHLCLPVHHYDHDRMYVMMDSAPSGVVQSSGNGVPAISPVQTSSSSPFFGFAHKWNESFSARDKATQGPQDPIASPVGFSAVDQRGLGQSSRPANMFMTMPVESAAGEETFDEPPPLYRN